MITWGGWGRGAEGRLSQERVAREWSVVSGWRVGKAVGREEAGWVAPAGGWGDDGQRRASSPGPQRPITACAMACLAPLVTTTCPGL